MTTITFSYGTKPQHDPGRPVLWTGFAAVLEDGRIVEAHESRDHRDRANARHWARDVKRWLVQRNPRKG